MEVTLTPDDGLNIPPHLRAEGKARLPREPRWKKMAPRPRPEAERWEHAERWEVYVGPELPALACGLRRVWVVEGRKWARLHDGENQIKVPMELWRRTQRSGRALAP